METVTKREFKAMKMLDKCIKQSATFSEPNENDLVRMDLLLKKRKARRIERIGGMPVQDLAQKLIECYKSGAIVSK